MKNIYSKCCTEKIIFTAIQNIQKSIFFVVFCPLLTGSLLLTGCCISLPLEKNCYGGPGIQQNRIHDVVKTHCGTIVISLGLPNSPSQAISDAVSSGMNNTKIALPYLVSYIASFPCDTLYIDSYLQEATGGPGSVHIGGSDPANGSFGIDDAWLLFHELTHSYFHSFGFYSWMAEGVATFLPTIITYDAFKDNNPPWEGLSHISTFPQTETDLSSYIQTNVINVINNILINEGVSPDTPLCQVETDYEKGSNLGRVFFAELYLKIGKSNFMDALSKLYIQYRKTGNKIVYQDIYNSFLSDTPSSVRSDVEKYLKLKLCIP